jgi:biotin synthase
VDLKTVYKQSKMFAKNVTVCSGGIIGMGESVEDRAGMFVALSTLNPQPESVPNALVPVEGTPMEEANRSRYGK